MSDPQVRGPLSAFAVPIAESVAKHQALPPDKKSANHAYVGGLICGVCGYVAVKLGPDAASYPDEWKLAFAGVAGFGLLLLVLGWRGARGRRDPLGALFAVVVPAGGFYAVMSYAPELLDEFYVRAICAGIIAANTIRFWIAIRGPGGGSAQKMVRRQIENMATPMKVGRPRKF
jgi:hypothetical protein